MVVRLLIEDICIVDYQEKKANRYVFSNDINLLVSKTNGEGKSSLIKSIYYALGCNIKSFPAGWEPEKYIFQLKVVIAEKSFFIKRQNKIMSVLDNGHMIIFENFQRYSNWFQEKMGMKLDMCDKGGKINRASLEALLSPMYIDQDRSWDGKLFKDSFEGLGRYKPNIFPKEIFEYYLGISDDEIINKGNRVKEYEADLNLIKVNIQQIQSVHETYSSQKNITTSIPQEYEDLEGSLSFYIEQTNKLSNIIVDKMKKVSEEKTKLDAWRQDYEELNKLLLKTKQRYSDVRYECVYCHSLLTREQSLTRLDLEDSKLAIISCREELNVEIKKLEENLAKKRDEIASLKENYDIYHKRLSEIEHLTDVNNYVNQKVLLELEKLEIQENRKHDFCNEKIKSIKREIKALKKECGEKRGRIEKEYIATRNEISNKVGTNGLVDKKFMNFTKLRGSGTNLNKDLLALFLTYMKLIDTESMFGLPFAIDSFMKNETDTKVLESMFKATKDYFLTLKNQTFFSIIEENLKYVDQKANKVTIEQPLLRKEKYKEIARKIIGQ